MKYRLKQTGQKFLIFVFCLLSVSMLHAQAPGPVAFWGFDDDLGNKVIDKVSQTESRG